MPMNHADDRNPQAQPDPASLAPSPRPLGGHAGHPLGPLWQMVPLDGPIGGRLYATGVLAAAIVVLAVAARLHPEGRYEGAHQQLGLPPCGFIVITGLPCPTCGMTTAFAYTIHGHPLLALRAQAVGFLLAVSTVAAALFAVISLVSGRRPAVNWYRIDPVRLVWIGCGLFVVAWGVKIVCWLLVDGMGR
ncbi:MAG: DUF2752 domain-containing protein [Planctomycetes bacterium]|nr:DUF2752 domain-containing protein [Planctomycetota bacterium]